MKKEKWIQILVLATALLWSACGTEGKDGIGDGDTEGTEQGEEGGPCYNNNTCNDGLVCQAGSCVACVGEEGCPCYPNQTCNLGLECSAAGTCEVGTPQQGCVGCACLPDGSCNEGLECGPGNLCQPKEGTATGCEGCPCGEGGSCDAELLCNASSICEAEGPTEDAAFASPGINTKAGGWDTGECPKVTASMNVPWVCQKMSKFPNWSSNMCCGPAC